MINAELASARAWRSALQATLDAAGASEDATRRTDEQTQSTLDAIAALDTQIARLEAIDFAIIVPIVMDVPYVALTRHGDGISSSKYTYGTEGNETGHIGIMEEDPTQFVLWGQAKRENVRNAFADHTRLPSEQYRWKGDCVLDFSLPVIGQVRDTNQYIAMRNTASEDSAEWNWAKSTGLQPNEDHCLLETRHHLRYFSSDDNALTHDPLGGMSEAMVTG